jgi:hypothetical protein
MCDFSSIVCRSTNINQNRFLRGPEPAAAEQGCQMAYFFKPEILIWVSLEGLSMEDVGIFYGHLVYITAIWNILWLFGIFSLFW